MKFKVGNFYKTRSGEKVVYIGENSLCKNKFKYIFAFSDGQSMCVCEHGRENDYEEEHDIMFEWPERHTFTLAYKEGDEPIVIHREADVPHLKKKGYQVQQVTFKGE